MPVVSPKPISCAPAATRRAGDLKDPLRLDAPLVGTAERDRDDAPRSADPSPRARASTGSSPVERLLDRAVDVRPVVRLARREEDVDLVEGRAPGAALASRSASAVSRPRLVRDQDADRDLGRHVDRAQDLGCVGELRDHVGPHEARDLDPAQAGAGEPSISRTLSAVGDDLRLVLEAVARPDLADPHGAGQPAGRGR